jgi:hypothetical protein
LLKQRERIMQWMMINKQITSQWMKMKFPKIYRIYGKVSSPSTGLLNWMYIGLFEDKALGRSFIIFGWNAKEIM